MAKLRLPAAVQIGAACLIAATFAAGLPADALAAPVVHNWTGCYLGGNLGSARAHNHYIDQEFAPLAISQGSHNDSSYVGGGQIGCDYQIKNWVVGVQALFDTANLHGSNVDPSAAPFVVTWQSKISWLATATGRIGYTLTPDTLLYAKAGAAWIRDHNLRSGGFGAAPVLFTTPDTTAIGWTLGAGFEWMFARHWSVFAEYDYMDFGARRMRVTRSTDGAVFPFDVKAQLQTLLAGINYRF